MLKNPLEVASFGYEVTVTEDAISNLLGYEAPVEEMMLTLGKDRTYQEYLSSASAASEGAGACSGP